MRPGSALCLWSPSGSGPTSRRPHPGTGPPAPLPAPPPAPASASAAPPSAPAVLRLLRAGPWTSSSATPGGVPRRSCTSRRPADHAPPQVPQTLDGTTRVVPGGGAARARPRGQRAETLRKRPARPPGAASPHTPWGGGRRLAALWGRSATSPGRSRSAPRARTRGAPSSARLGPPQTPLSPPCAACGTPRRFLASRVPAPGAPRPPARLQPSAAAQATPAPTSAFVSRGRPTAGVCGVRSGGRDPRLGVWG